MNVCHFCSTSIEGAYFSYIADGLTNKGVNLSFVTLNEPGEPAWLISDSQIGYCDLDVRSRAMYPLAVWRLARFLRQNKVDILHTHLFDAAMIGLLAGRLAGTRIVVVSRHHLDETHLLGSGIHVALDKWSNR